MEKRGGTYNNQQRDLGRPSWYLQAQGVIPTSSFAHQQNQVVGVFWPWNSVGHRPAWHGSSSSVSGPNIWLAHTQASNWIIVPSTVKCVFQPHLTKRAVDKVLKHCSSVELEPKGRWADLNVPSEKQVPGVEGSCVMHTRGIKLQTRQKVAVAQPDLRVYLGN